MENWKPVEGYEGLYEVSDLGRVRSLPRMGTCGKILKPCDRQSKKFNKKYLRVGLTKDGKVKWHSVHVLVAKAFIPNPDNLPEVDHINNDETDNRACNLQWITRKDNIVKDHGHAVMCVETGQIFETKADALEWMGLPRDSGELSRVCDCENKSTRGYHWVRINRGEAV